MQKPGKLLKVISIITIILGTFSFIGNILVFAMRDTLNSVYESMGMSAYTLTAAAILFSLCGSAIILASGIAGVLYRSRKSVLIAGIILTAYYVVSIIYTTVTVQFSPSNILSLILPALYLWGWYRSN